ncbi:UDP-N-acetylmuramoyl-L-alanyl-D-glutamate--2,6-diaminopimelate ligase MurE homolog, chloroplastic isoform X2 [Dendrobium catenatum]|nr:UDP-N-acetylmuramoyl-L-alanyl-D-glutamate--2,6-diaminopimelate ligase MurE homolog, chloroplastic isoform X2 [Dendrobium catenatum]
MALSAISFITFSKILSSTLLPFRRPLPSLFAAGDLREGVSLEKTISLHSHGKHQNDRLGGLHLAIVQKRLEERTLDSRSNQEEDGSSSGHIAKASEFRMALCELLEQSKIIPLGVCGDIGVTITGIENDSRKVRPGDLFVCCIGYKTDGHYFINDAIERGAVAVLACRKIDLDGILDCGALVIVEDVNSLLPSLAANFYGNPSKRMSVIGVTGTNGKTTTTHLVRAIYEAMGVKTGMLGTVGYHGYGESQLDVPNTTPDALTVQKLMARMEVKETQAVVMEASSQGLALGRCDAIDFDVAVFTNLTRDHYDFHGSEEDYKNSKAKLFARMVDPNHHCKIVNIDDPNAKFFVSQGKKGVPVVTYAMENKKADVCPLTFELSLSKTDILIITPKGVLEISTRLIGRHNIYNILAAVAVGVGVDAKLEDIKKGIEGVDGISGRFELIHENQPFGVIVDYAHSPDALSRILDTVRELGARRIITVFGCAGESDRGKRSMMAKIATDRSEVVVLTSDNPKTENPANIYDDMLSVFGWTVQDYVRHSRNECCLCLPNGHKLFVHDLRRVAVRAAIAMAEEGDAVVVAGRGHETFQLEGNKKVHIDDREECRAALRDLDKLRQVGLGKCIPRM